MKNKNIIIGFIILFIAIIFRFLFIDKTGGLWYDEIVSYKEAAQNDLISTIAYTLKTDVHLPLYPALLHIWTKLFSISDVSLRAFSAVCGVLSVIAAFMCGKALKSEEAGLWCSGVFALNSFLIYYSQEVRLYSLLTLLVTLLTYFSVKVYKEKDNTVNAKIFGLLTGITVALVIYTYTISFIYVIPVLLILYFVKHKNREDMTALNYGAVLFVIACLPAFIYLLGHYTNYTNQINGYYCDWSSLFVVMQDWFSPVLEGIFNNPVHYMGTLFADLTLKTILFIFVPVIISSGVIWYAVKRDKQAVWLLIPSIIFLFAEIIAFKFTNFKILARYASVALPNILIVFGLGLSLLPKAKKIKVIIASILILINLGYLVFSNNAAYKLPRFGFRAVSELINEQMVNNGDYVTVWNRKEILDKYVKTENLNILSILKDFAYRSENILGAEAEINKLSLEERKKLLRPYFSDVRPSQNNIALMTYILTNMKKGQKFIITSNEYFDKFSPEIFKQTVDDDEKFNLISYNDLLTIKSLITVKEMCAYNLKFIGRYEKDGSVIFVFEK